MSSAEDDVQNGGNGVLSVRRGADVVLEVQSIRRGVSSGVAGKGIWDPILHPWDVHHGKPVAECLLKVSEADVTDVQ